jgi:60 kDa SS-A/Ro ribonucleoprotein
LRACRASARSGRGPLGKENAMNAIETKVGILQSRAKDRERSRAFDLPEKTLICLHVSGSPETSSLEVAGSLRQKTGAELVPFTGPSCRILRHLNERRRTADLVLFVSDGRCWADFGTIATGRGKRLATMSEEWMLFRARSRRARLVLIDLQARGMTRVMGHPEVLQVGGISDAMFNVISLFAAGKLDVEH